MRYSLIPNCTSKEGIHHTVSTIGNETSPFLNPGYKFSVSASLLEDQCFEDFDGSSYINNLMNGDYTITDIHIYYSVSLEWKTGLKWKGEKMNVLEKLWDQKMLMDCVIVASNKAEIMCHRSILAAHSDVLFAMLTCGLEESQTNRIRMEETSELGINILVKYFYKNEVDDKEISFEVALELLQMAHKYDISKLEVIMLNILFRKSEEWFTLDNVVDLYVDTKQVADVTSGNDSYCYGLLRDRMFNIIKR
ncbi:Kelch-like protein 2 [Orchesella cincta]|uniref:Kelch-like protein 2 n=1 Tax=Orchesella cincta TaxID=48709 RepID=A0A1D2M4H0_ORCCI|nr:Kelch-like protein 2 [Orchesella cincta]